MKAFLKILSVIASIIICIAIAAFLFIRLWKPMGGSASEEDRQNYASRAENYRDGLFYNDDEFDIMTVNSGVDDKVMSFKDTSPKSLLPVKEPVFDAAYDISDVSVTWFGHSSLLIHMHGMNILIDPTFSERISPVSFIGPKRFSPSAVTVEELPQIDVLIISHDHYDHLDYNTVLALDEKVSRYVVPLGVENHLERWGINSEKITNMAWWEEIDIDGLTIACTPSKHYSGRSLNDRYKTLWASWVLRDEYHQIYESGDSGYGSHFQKIHDKYGDFDFVMIDCAQYNTKWANVHMFPEEAVKAALTLGTKVAMPIHWGAMSLAEHAWDDSVRRFVDDGEKNGLTVFTPYLCQTADIGNAHLYSDHWWENIE